MIVQLTDFLKNVVVFVCKWHSIGSHRIRQTS